MRVIRASRHSSRSWSVVCSSGSLALVALLAGVAAPLTLSACGRASEDADSSGVGGLAGSGGNSRQSGGQPGTGGTGSSGQGTGGDGGTALGSGGEGGGDGTAGAGGQGTDLGAVHGKVLDPTGRAVARANVLIEGQVVVTDDAGAFEMDDVPAVYDLIVRPRDARDVTVWQGVTRRDPIAMVRLDHVPPHQSVSGSVLGGHGFGDPATYPTQVGYLCDDGSRASIDQTSASFELGVSWKHWGTASCRLMALESTIEDGYIASQLFGSRELELSPTGAALVDQDVELSAKTPVKREFTVGAAPGALETQASWGPFLTPLHVEIASASLVFFSVTVPDASIPVFVKAKSNGLTAQFSFVNEGGPTFIGFDDAVTDVSPEVNAVIPRDQEFVASRPALNLEHGTYAFWFWTSEYYVWVYANEVHAEYPAPSTGTVRVPDLEPLGVELTSPFNWEVEFVDSPRSVDTALGAHAAPTYRYTSTMGHNSWE